MADTLTLPLCLPLSANRKIPSLKSGIERINKQRAAFRHVTEASLLKDIEHSDRVRDGPPSDEASEVEGTPKDEEDGLTPEQRQELVWKRRQEMLQQLEQARNDTLMALDFVSLLLSKSLAAAESTMSPVLRQAVPRSTLEGRLVRPMTRLEAENKLLTSVSQGWKAHAFESAANKLSKAGSRIKALYTHESVYWKQISSLKTKGWAISRLRRDNGAVVIHFGFVEAAPAFRARGIAMLRQDESGVLRLDRSIMPSKPKTMHVRIVRNGQICGSSSPPALEPTNTSVIEEQILQARGTLFEEELFHEISREGRGLASHGVTLSTKVVNVEIHAGYQIQINLTNSETGHPPVQGGMRENVRADLIGLVLRLLLAYAHRQNLLRRSRPPPPILPGPVPSPVYPLLRPLLSYLQHEFNLSSMQRFFGTISKTFVNAGLQVNVQVTSVKNLGLSAFRAKAKVLTDSVFKVLLAPVESAVTIRFPTARISEIKIKTFLGQPTYGTEYSLESLKYPFAQLAAVRFTALADLQDFIRHTLVLDMVCLMKHLLLAKAPELETMKSLTQPLWEIIDPHDGKLALYEENHVAASLQVKLWQNKLELRHVQERRANPTGVSNALYSWEADNFWTAGGHESSESPQFTQVIQTILTDADSDNPVRVPQGF